MSSIVSSMKKASFCCLLVDLRSTAEALEMRDLLFVQELAYSYELPAQTHALNATMKISNHIFLSNAAAC